VYSLLYLACLWVKETHSRPCGFFPAASIEFTNAGIIQSHFLVACVKRDKREMSRKVSLVSTLGALPTGNDTKTKDISCKTVVILKHQVFWVVALCDWVAAARRVEGTHFLQLQGSRELHTFS